MGRINVLQPTVFNMIAAGEVVERPASVVKELVENSIDAGATVIDVTIEGGGSKRMQVSDNGVGILEEDMRSAFLPHATSKIKNIADLDAVSTLGFRGEALASIASVSEITLVSRAKGALSAGKIMLYGGTVVFESVDSRAEGTCITVDNLFFNIPARNKFLSKPIQEQRYIADVFKRIVLANPNISFSLTADGEYLVRHEAGALIDALYSVYDAELAKNMLEVDYVSPAGITVKGYVSGTEYVKSSRAYQTVIVNGRSVSDQTVTLAAEKAYDDRLMKHKFPCFVLDVIMPFDKVDINVHPAKTEVRFADKRLVFGAVFRAVENALKAAYVPGKHIRTDNKDYADKVASDKIELKPVYTQEKLDTSSLYTVKQPSRPSYGNYYGFGSDRNPVGLKETQGSAFSYDFSDSDGARNYIGNGDTIKKSADRSTAFGGGGSALDEALPKGFGRIKGVDFTHSSSEPKEEAEKRFDGSIVGQIFSTYILIERDDKLYMIDQHAAHERILYDELVKKLDKDHAQPLLIPYKFSLSAEESEYFDRILPSLNDMGFEIEYKFGNYLVRALPKPVAEMNFKRFVNELFSSMLRENELSLADIVKEEICQKACKAAIKGGDKLSREQIEYVIRNLLDKDGNLPDKCPHGRPCVIALEKRDLEKMFKRIV